MLDDQEKISLSRVRYIHAEECLREAESLLMMTPTAAFEMYIAVPSQCTKASRRPRHRCLRAPSVCVWDWMLSVCTQSLLLAA